LPPVVRALFGDPGDRVERERLGNLCFRACCVIARNVLDRWPHFEHL
jgi:hypothetical protein